MKIKIEIYLSILLSFLQGCCKVETTITKDPIEKKQVAFNIIPLINHPATGVANIYYTYNGVTNYVFGNDLQNENWSADSCLIIPVNVPVNSTVHYLITMINKDSSQLQYPALLIRCNDKIIFEYENINKYFR